MSETWTTIPGFDGYEASDLGRVRSTDRLVRAPRGSRRCAGRILSPRVDRYGYLRVNLSVGNVHVTAPVHRLIALAFLGAAPSESHEVAHGDGTRCNNALTNLRWATTVENSDDRRLHGTRLSVTQVDEIRAALRAGVMQKTLARRYDVGRQTICNIANGTGCYAPARAS
jgi:hypothetical protein